MGRTFSDTLSSLRQQRGLSQRTAAADLKISQALLSHYENGTREPGLGFVVRACDYYGVTADYLLGRADNAAHSYEISALVNSLREATQLAEKLAEDCNI